VTGGSRRRIELAAAYVLHRRPWRDSSRILEVLSRDHGRITLFARGVRGAKSQSASILQPFHPLLLSWSGSGDAARLTQVERALDPSVDAPVGRSGLPASALMSAWYLNELLLALTVRNDPQPAVFDLYHHALAALAAGQAPAAALRRFERLLLDQLGYGMDFATDARSGEPVREGGYYHFHASMGFVEVAGGEHGNAVPGSSLLAMAAGDFAPARVLEDARRIMRTAIDHVLEGRELRTRAVAQSIARSAGPRSRGSAVS
jgi:DNA repair protein RecO (recombination protein O)